ncbi:unnamed protein product [Linum tenue]|uniref:Uncharacterized protein n=1 Tax=Linum tenue TaxID=586396 RepID=A0AAV0MQ97_9ROSI|nr:unnamed protein product [Linum tenue]
MDAWCMNTWRMEA